MGRTTPQTEQRQDEARSRYLAGMTWQEVADSPDPTSEIGESRPLYATAAAARSAASHAQARAMGMGRGQDKPPSQEERRRKAHDRYDLLIFAWMERAMEGDDVAATIVLRAQQAQARLYGLNLRPIAAPAESSGGEVDPVDELARRRAERRGTGTSGT